VNGRAIATPGRGWRWLCLLGACLLVAVAHAAALEFSRVTVTLGEDDRIYLDAQTTYTLPPVVSEALDNGVPLTFVTHVQMRDTQAWLWQKDVADYRIRSVLRYRPLAGLYEVRVDDGDKQVFATREAALRYMGRISDLALIERGRLDLSHEYKVRLDAYLDIEALPLPLRPRAYLSGDWNLEAEPWEWQIKP
jgi:hypothetical protein